MRTLKPKRNKPRWHDKTEREKLETLKLAIVQLINYPSVQHLIPTVVLREIAEDLQ